MIIVTIIDNLSQDQMKQLFNVTNLVRMLKTLYIDNPSFAIEFFEYLLLKNKLNNNVMKLFYNDIILLLDQTVLFVLDCFKLQKYDGLLDSVDSILIFFICCFESDIIALSSQRINICLLFIRYIIYNII